MLAAVSDKPHETYAEALPVAYCEAGYHTKQVFRDSMLAPDSNVNILAAMLKAAADSGILQVDAFSRKCCVGGRRSSRALGGAL